MERAEGLLISLSGDLDLATVPKLKNALAPQVEGGVERFLLDLAEVRHLDSSALGLLVWLQKRVGKGGVVLRGVAPHLRKILEITGLEPLFTYSESA